MAHFRIKVLFLFFILLLVLFFGVIQFLLLWRDNNEVYDLSPSQLEQNMQLAKNGDSEAALNLWLYYEFYAVDKKDSDKKAEFYLKLSAKLGNPTAQYNLGYYFQNNTKDHATALYWYQKAAAQNDPDAKKAVQQIREMLKP